MSRKPIATADLSLEQQEHVINALYFLRVKFGIRCLKGRPFGSAPERPSSQA